MKLWILFMFRPIEMHLTVQCKDILNEFESKKVASYQNTCTYEYKNMCMILSIHLYTLLFVRGK